MPTTMSDTVELLNFIYKNAQMGQESIGYLLKVVDDPRMRQHLRRQQEEYAGIMEDAHGMMQEDHAGAQGVGAVAKMSAYMMVNMKTMVDKTPSHIAQMMIEGSTKGTIEITKKLKLYKGVDQPAEKLGRRLLAMEEDNIEKLKKFLA